jgi:phosphoglucosamine mutase
VLVAAGLADAGIAITASHNPAHDNGLKVVGAEGCKLDTATEAALERGLQRALESGNWGRGSIQERHAEGQERYESAVLAALPKGRWLLDRKIAVDCAHGAAWKTAPRILEALGAQVVRLGCEPDGENINAGVGAMHPEVLAGLVRAESCDAGIALDGDADRCVLVASDGSVLDGDALLLLLAVGPGVVGTIMCNEALAQALRRRGMDLVRTPVGDRHIAQEMRRSGWPIGGEPSGHVLLGDGLPTGDGLLTGLRILSGGLDLGHRLVDWKPHAQASATVVVSARPPLAQLAPLQWALGKLTGRAVVRYSGTEPKLRLQVEAAQAEVAESELQSLLQAVRASGLGEP